MNYSDYNSSQAWSGMGASPIPMPYALCPMPYALCPMSTSCY
ncbi:hypothetical protein [Microcoleus sp.]